LFPNFVHRVNKVGQEGFTVTLKYMDKSSLRHTVIVGFVVGCGVGLSMIAAFFVNRWEVSRQHNRFQQQIENLTITLQRSLNRYTDLLSFLSDHYRVSGPVPRQTFEQFVARSLQVYPGIQALEWAPVVNQRDRRAFEQTVRGEGFSTFQIQELGADNRLMSAGNRAYYIPVTYIAPLAGNEAALGFDLNSSETRLAAIEPARDSGEIQATGRIRLVQEQRDQYGFLVVLPLYRSGAVPATLADRQAEFDGLLVGVFRIADVVEETLADLSYEIDFVIHDQNAPPGSQFLGHYDAKTQALLGTTPSPSEAQGQTLCLDSAACIRTLNAAQRQWRLEFLPAETYPLSPSYGTWATLLTGLLLTGSLVLFLRNLQTELFRSQALSELKQRFFSMASHELRTPLSTILLTAESLDTHYGELSEEQRQRNTRRIHITAQQMSQQITDLLTLTRAEAGRLDFNPELLSVPPFCQQIIQEMQPGIAQTIRLTSSTDTRAFWDKKLMRSLLTNLIANAAKYSPANTPIQVRLSQHQQRAILQVSDQGIGILAAEQNDVQTAFRRGSNVGDIEGTGLGLAIVKTCVEHHQGTWHIDSKEGQGTTVTVTLPLE
jgi:signal transduction histidine kinase